MGLNNLPVYAALVVISISIGFWAGTKTKKRSNEHSAAKTEILSFEKKPSDGNESDKLKILDDESDSEHSNVGDGDISSLRVDPVADNCKMVLVVRTDLGMTSGKIAAQCSHAALACYKALYNKNPTLLRQWEKTGQTKVALQCGDEDELLLLQAQAQSLNLCARTIADAGRTQIAAGSKTVLGIAGPARLVNQITGKLRLL